MGALYTLFTLWVNDYVIKNGGDEKDRITHTESLILFFLWPVYVLLIIAYLLKHNDSEK
jgi:hypothetical protein